MRLSTIGVGVIWNNQVFKKDEFDEGKYLQNRAEINWITLSN
jgi:hypothetical protein